MSHRLLQYILDNEPRFEHTGLGPESRIDRNARISRRLLDLGTFGSVIESRVAAMVPALTAELGLTPFRIAGFETELVAHEDGAFYGRHIDLIPAAGKAPVATFRALSIVHYLFSEPKAFTGGALRLVPNGGMAPVQQEDIRDIPPEQDMAVAFSSWLPHAVLPVTVPSRQFRDARFAINCWVLAATGAV